MTDSKPLIAISPHIDRLVCSMSGRAVDTDGFSRPVGLCRCCPAPGRPVVVEYDLAAAADQLETDPPRPERGLFAWEALLPVHGLPEAYAADVGTTPVVRHPGLSGATGVQVLLKNEGTNPSGSFKDRGLAMGVAFGAACGARRFCLPTQGNAGVAAALFSARLGLPGALVYMPDGYQDSIYHREAVFFGAEVRFAGDNIAATGRQMRADCATELASGAFVDMSTFFEPGRLEGKKTMGLELVAQLGASHLPDYILYPTGGGTGLVGIWKAFQELVAIGRIAPSHHRLPAMVAVQSAGCAPVVESFDRGLDVVEPVQSRGTVADGLDVPGAIMGHGILGAIRASGGFAVAVEEEAIVSAHADLGRHGVAGSFESAALLAALVELRRAGRIAADAEVLLLMTASHLVPLGKREVPGMVLA